MIGHGGECSKVKAVSSCSASADCYYVSMPYLPIFGENLGIHVIVRYLPIFECCKFISENVSKPFQPNKIQIWPRSSLLIGSRIKGETLFTGAWFSLQSGGTDAQVWTPSFLWSTLILGGALQNFLPMSPHPQCCTLFSDRGYAFVLSSFCPPLFKCKLLYSRLISPGILISHVVQTRGPPNPAALQDF